MFLQKIALQNFRNIENLKLSFDNPITILYGENGQGKSNIVESIYVLANAISFRTNYFKEMITTTKEVSVIEGETISPKKKDRFKVVLQNSGKGAFINDISITKFSEYIGKINAICFSPEDVFLFKDSPGVRRRFLDKELSSMFPIYIQQLIVFKSVLEQRNDLLKGNVDMDLLDIIDDKLIESSYDVYKRRKWLVEKVSEFATKIYKEITNESQNIKIVYHTFLDEFEKENYLKKAKAIYQSNFSRDKEKLYTINGIHKDDFKVFLNDLEIDMYASQGQQRLISLVMKLAIHEIITKANKVEPILILDDAFSELDGFKKQKLFTYISKKQQVFITCTDYRNITNNMNKGITLLHVNKGKILERSSI